MDTIGYISGSYVGSKKYVVSFVIEVIVFGVKGSKTVLLNNRIIFVHILSAIKKRVERVVGL